MESFMKVGKKEPKIDFQKMVELLKASHDSLEHSKDKDIVLIIGNTGAGKSSVFNYLLGAEMDVLHDSFKPKVKVANPVQEIAKIGHENESETLIPILAENPEKKITYCDCPGFLDNRPFEIKTTAYMGINIAIQQARNVKGVIVVIDTNSLDVDRAVNLRTLVSILAQFIQNPQRFQDSCVWVFNKRSDLTRKTILELIKKILASERKYLENGSESDHQQRLLLIDVLEAIIDHPTRIVVADLLKGDTRAEIETQLNSLSNIEKKDFFSEYSDSQVKFKEFVCKAATQILKVLKKAADNQLSLVEKREELKSVSQKIPYYQNFIEQLNQQGSNPEELSVEDIKLFDGKLTLFQKDYDELSDKLDKETLSLSESKEKLLKLDSKENILFLEKKYSTNKSYLGFLFGGRPSDSIKLQRPIAKTIADPKDFFNFTNADPKNGVLEYTLGINYSFFGSFSAATLKIFIEKRHYPGTAEMIIEAEKAIVEIEDRVQKFKEDKEKVKREMTVLKRAQDHLMRLSKEDKERRIEHLHQLELKKKEHLNVKDSLTQGIAELEDNIKCLNTEIEEKLPLINALLKIFGFVRIESPVVEAFKQQAKAIQIINQDFGPHENPIKEAQADEEFFSELECPISSEIMKDPVVLDVCLHAFDRINLLQALKTSQKCPYCGVPATFENVKEMKLLTKVIEKANSIPKQVLPLFSLFEKFSYKLILTQKMDEQTAMKFSELDSQLEDYDNQIDSLLQFVKSLSNGRAQIIKAMQALLPIEMQVPKEMQAPKEEPLKDETISAEFQVILKSLEQEEAKPDSNQDKSS